MTWTNLDLGHTFRIHKFILSLASPIFKDMFTLPQPPNLICSAQSDLSIIDITDRPAVLDMILQFIYPGAEPPKFTAYV